VWRDYLAPSVLRAGELDRLFNSSTAAVFCFEAAGRRFALTLGYGRFLLEPDSYEHDFGLRVVLNAVDPDLIRSVDARTIDDVPMQTQRNASRGSPIGDFGLDVTRDLVRSIAGPPSDVSLGRYVAGADRLAVSTDARLDELPDLCKRLLKVYKSKTYKTRYPWIDQVRPVKDEALIEELNNLMVDTLREREIDFLHLAPPESVDQMRLAGFGYSRPKNAGPDPDPRISTYLDAFDDPAKITLDRLKNDRIYAYEAEGDQLIGSYSVFNCIVFETLHRGALFVLNAGDWFRVSRPFQQQTIKFVEDLPDLDLDLPDADLGAGEDEYNEKATNNDPDLLDLHGHLVNIPDQYGGVELCDLLSRNKQLLHVKRRGKSSTLSHLFFQGLNSAELLLRDAEFRTGARKVVDNLDSSFTSSLPANRPGVREYEIAFVFITRATPRQTNPYSLPFFSLLSLQNAARQLDAFGFKVSGASVPEA
jgi:uncharacterized protein (TIGR04141 family)